MRRKTLTLLVVVLAAFTLAAQDQKDAKKDAKKAPARPGILHPEMKVENGSYDKPMATLGSKPDQPWTTTSVAAGVDNKPQPGRAMQKNHHGHAHFGVFGRISERAHIHPCTCGTGRQYHRSALHPARSASFLRAAPVA